jgi:hypothetical protein
MRKIYLILALLFIGQALTAQNVLLHKEVSDSEIVKFGPNLKNFRHFYFGLGFIAGKPDSTGSDIITGYSMNYLVGFRYKLRVTNWFAIGYDIDFTSYGYRLKQASSKITPDTILHDKEKLTFSDLGADIYMRFNYGRRGNRIGNFIDLGGYADWVFSARNYMKDKIANGNVVETTISHLNYFNPYNYGAVARIGFNRYVLFGYYRLSDIFKTSYNYPELPRITIGLQIGIHK